MTPSHSLDIPNDLWKLVGRSGYFFEPHPRSSHVQARIHVHRVPGAVRHVVALIRDARGQERQRLRALARTLESIPIPERNPSA